MDGIDLYKERYFIKEYIGRFELYNNDIEGLNMRIRNRLTELKDQKEEYNKPTPKPIPKPSPLVMKHYGIYKKKLVLWSGEYPFKSLKEDMDER